MTEYICREVVLSKCDDIWDAADETTQTGVDIINTIDKVMDFIESLPSADVRPVKHGKWEQLVSRKSGFHYEVGARCSCCNEYTITVCLCEAMPFEFCPHCTADMRGDTND